MAAHQEAMSESERKTPAAAPAAAVSWKCFVKVLLRLLSCLLACSCKSSNPNLRRPADTYQDTEKVRSKIHMPQDRIETIRRIRETKCENKLRTFRIHKSTVFVSCRFSHLVGRSSVNPPFFGRFRTEFLNRPELRTRRYRWLAGFKEECRRSCFP
jgi:hypothetical protein